MIERRVSFIENSMKKANQLDETNLYNERGSFSVVGIASALKELKGKSSTIQANLLIKWIKAGHVETSQLFEILEYFKSGKLK